MRIVAPLKALLSNLIDYAGLYPPAGLPLESWWNGIAAFWHHPMAGF